MLLKYIGICSCCSALSRYLLITYLSVQTLLFHVHIPEEIRILNLLKTSLQILFHTASSKRTLTKKNKDICKIFHY